MGAEHVATCMGQAGQLGGLPAIHCIAGAAISLLRSVAGGAGGAGVGTIRSCAAGALGSPPCCCVASSAGQAGAAECSGPTAHRNRPTTRRRWEAAGQRHRRADAAHLC